MSNIHAAVPLGTDQEARVIYRLLTNLGVPTHRLTRGGRFVNSYLAYRSDQLVPEVPESCEYLLKVECDGPAFDHIRCKIITIDHHYPGDPGYGKGPEEFLPASSLGQVVSFLARHGIVDNDWTPFEKNLSGVQPGDIVPVTQEDGGQTKELWVVCAADNSLRQIPKEIVYSAASDHCLLDAYHKRCHGVSKNSLMSWRIVNLSRSQRVPPFVVSNQIRKARQILRTLYNPAVKPYADLTGIVPPPSRLSEAAAIEGIPFLCMYPGTRGKRLFMCSQDRELLQRFAAGEIVPNLKEVYGDPARGFMGGVV